MVKASQTFAWIPAYKFCKYFFQHVQLGKKVGVTLLSVCKRDQNYFDRFENKYELSTFQSWSIKQHANPVTSYPLYTALLLHWRVSYSSPLAYLRERTCELDIGAFLHCKEFEDLLRAIGLRYCKSWGIVKMKRWELIPLIQKGAFRRCGWNCRDVILFSVVRKITASRENRRELLGDEVMKTASHRNCTVQVTLVEFKQPLYRAGNGSLFLHRKATLLISVKIINQSILCSTIQQSVKYEDLQHFVSRNLWTLGTHNHITGIQNSKCSLYWSHPFPILRVMKT